ncbi:hypothetical protein NLO93_27795, partial [Pseudomonas savastanoi]|nr:hypothetical protein [Pseudomonas savastanoi]
MTSTFAIIVAFVALSVFMIHILKTSTENVDALYNRDFLAVTTCNRNGLDLQSSRFSTGIDCVYPAPRTSIDCKRTCIQPLR